MMVRVRECIKQVYLAAKSNYVLGFFSLLCIVLWPLLLLNTNSYFSIYVICGMAAALAFVYNRTHKQKEGKLVYGVTIAFSCLFSAFVVLANYALFLPVRENIVKLLVAFIAGVIVAQNVLLLLLRRLPKIEAKTEKKPVYKPVVVFLVPFVILSAIYLIYLFYCAYPGMLTGDSFNQVSQALSTITSNHHPFWHTVIVKVLLSVGLRLFGNINSAVALYSVCQLLVFSATISFSLMTLYTAGVKKRYVFLCGLPFAILPYHIVYSVCMWKDIWFAMATLLFAVFFFRTVNAVGNRTFNGISLFLSSVLFCVWRSNAWLAMLASLVLFFVFMRKKRMKTVLILAAAVVVSWVMRSPVISMLGIEQPDFVESLSIPVQQVARVIVDDGYISDEDYKALDKIMDVNEVKDLYLDYLSDPIKNEIRSKDQNYLAENKMEYLKLWVRIGLDNPTSYVAAWVDQTKGYYNSGYKYWVTPYREANDVLGIEKKPLYNPTNEFFLNLNKKMNENVLAQPFISIGFCVWILTAFGIVLFLRKREEWLITIPLLMVVATLLVATPVFSEFRYVYFMFMTMPFLITVGIHTFNPKNGGTQNG